MLDPLYNEFAYLLVLTVTVLMLPTLRYALVTRQQQPSESTTLKTNTTGRYELFDALRGIAIIGVILIHVVYIAFELPLITHALGTDILNALNASMRFALPIFFITSGILLKPVALTVKDYMRFMWSRSIQLLPPYILATGAIMLLFHASWSDFFWSLISGGAAVPFYFIPVLMQLYLVYPFVAPYAKNTWFVYATLLFSLMTYFVWPSGIVYGIPTAGKFLFFLVWGIYMRDHILEGTIQKTVRAWLLMVAACVVAYICFPGEYFNIRPFYGTAVFMLLCHLWMTYPVPKRVTHVLSTIGSHSLWIFLTHFTLMQFVMSYLYITIADAVPGLLLFVCLTVVSLVLSIVCGFVCTYLYTAIMQCVRSVIPVYKK